MVKRSSVRKPPRAIGVKKVPTNNLVPNPHNPRLLFDREPLKVLQNSIEKVGILVPLTVYMAKGEDKYTILDGQRRWICAQAVGLNNVPVNEVEEPTVAQNIVTMFQIHKLRKDWELMPTALKLEVLMDALKERKNEALAVHTGLDVAVVVRCKKLLWYPKKYRDMMLFADPEQRVKADFFIELYPVITDRVVVKADWYKRDYVVERMLHKYENKLSGLKAITDFRKIKQFIAAARTAGQEQKLVNRLHEFLEDDKLDLEHISIEQAQIYQTARKFTSAITKIHQQLRDLEPKEFYGEEEMWRELERLLHTIQRKLRDADRR